MSTALNTQQVKPEIPKSSDFRFDIVTAEWNADVTYKLRDGAIDTFRKAGIPDENIRLWKVPGAVELVNIAAMILNRKDSDGVLVFGCVIRGDTPHFDYVCQHTTQGVSTLNSRGEIPVIFGLLTVENLQQALDRAGGILGNKGSEAADTAIAMANLKY